MSRAAPRFRVQFETHLVKELAGKYLARCTEKERRLELRIERDIAPAVRRRGFYTRDEFLELCLWKTPRSKRRCAENDEAFVHEATKVALGAEHERLRIESLLMLRGVSWPTASVLLHFGHRDPYPILDFRALHALGANEPASGYDFAFWWAYVVECRRLAQEAKVPMRTLDRALWEWSKTRPGRKPAER